MRVLVIAAMMVTAPAYAETFSGGAVGIGTSANEMVPIADGHMVMRTTGSYEAFEVEAGHPLEGASGPCFGVVEMMGAEISGSGKCVFETGSGDKAIMGWEAKGLTAEGALVGDWSVTGGTGSWANASGGGSFSSLTDPETGKFANTITGDITIE